jgi:uncharacterized protein YrzB (UPF0473 family)
MDNLKDNQLIFVNDKNEEVVCDILFTYHSDNFNKDYVFFISTNDVNEDGSREILCASYIEKDNSIGELREVESKVEWEELYEVINSYLLDAEEDEEDE